MVLGVLMLVLVGCTDNNTIIGPEKNEAQTLPSKETVASIKLIDAPKAVAYPIMIDKSTVVGNVSVLNTKDFIYINYLVDKDWVIKETNVHVAASIEGIPQSREGYPSPHQFAYRNTFGTAGKTQSMKIEMADHNFQIGQQVLIAINFGLLGLENMETRARLIMGWGGTKNGPGPEWWSVIPYTLMEEKNQGTGEKIDNVIVLDRNDNVIVQ